VPPETADERGAAVLERVGERLAADRDTPILSASGGVAVYLRDGDAATLVLRAADRTLYEAKKRRGTARRVESSSRPHAQTA